MAIEESRIDHNIRFLLGDLELIAEDLERWDYLCEATQDIRLYDWPNDRTIFEGLERAYRASEMSADQEERYRELKANVREMPPALELSGLRVPQTLLER
jgi:hypothetical protein